MEDKKITYFNDEDEDFLKFMKNDSIEEQAKDMGIVSQVEDLLAYSIDGLYTNEKQDKFITGRKLRDNPPSLKISSSKGDEVSFILTKEFTKMLLNSLTEVNKAYSGYKYSVEKKEYNSFKVGTLQSVWLPKVDFVAFENASSKVILVPISFSHCNPVILSVTVPSPLFV